MESDHLEALLRDSRPEPRPGFREELAEELFPVRRASRLQRPLLVAAATVTAMAVGVLALSLAGTGPLGDSGGGAEATTNCRTVNVIRQARVPYLVRSSDGRTRIAYRYERRQRHAWRCP